MTNRSLRIGIATNGRFHVLDLARELAALGHDVQFYSALPDARAERFGLAARYCRSLFALLAPFVAWQRWAPRLLPQTRERLYNTVLNRAIMARLERCDVFIGMSGLILEAAQAAKDRFGATIFIERGSHHILSQKRILESAGHVPPTDYAVERELADYRLADRILVPSRQAMETFRFDEIAFPKLRLDPYGVDLAMFPQRERIPGGPPTLIFVGSWDRQKGADVLVKALERLPEVHLIHVGPLAGEPFPQGDRFRHVEPVDQAELYSYYHMAHVHSLSSRQDGLGMVQIQALASGLPVVCSDKTGGIDLGYSPALRARLTEVPAEDDEALAHAIAAVMAKRMDIPPLADEDRNLLSWRCYAERYCAVLEEAFAHRTAA